MKKFTMLISLLLIIKYSECCDCKEKNAKVKKIKEKTRSSNSKFTVGKRQLHEAEYDNSDIPEYGEAPVAIPATTTKVTVLNETHFELNETEFRTAVVESYNRCPFYKKSPDLDLAKMVDVWKLAFYRSSVNLGCFKVLIKGLSDEARQFYQDKYGSFNKTIRWNDCVFQLTSNGDGAYENHFLQAVANCSGLLENIILSEENNGNLSILSLQDHSPDQWLALDQLLLMRDCENGDIVVFTRIPNKPTQRDIDAALTLFGEEDKQGTWACRGIEEIHLQNPKYQIIS